MKLMAKKADGTIVELKDMPVGESFTKVRHHVVDGVDEYIEVGEGRISKRSQMTREEVLEARALTQDQIRERIAKWRAKNPELSEAQLASHTAFLQEARRLRGD